MKTIVIPQCSHTLPSTNIHVPCFSTRLPFPVQTSLCGPAHMWLLNQFDREVQAATCIQRAWRAYHQRVAGMSDEERKKMELRWVRCGKALIVGVGKRACVGKTWSQGSCQLTRLQPTLQS